MTNKKTKNILVLYYSQSGQLKNLAENFTSPLDKEDDIDLTITEIKTTENYPFPWKSFSTFINVFPECVYNDVPDIAIDDEVLKKDYDLIIFAYQVWYLSPSLPATGFLKSEYAKKLLKDKPVITLIGCRNMWLQAQEETKKMLSDIGAKLIDNVVLTDQGNSLVNLITTPRWLLTGKKEPFWGIFPEAGIKRDDIEKSSRFGARLVEALRSDEETLGKPLLKGLGAVDVDEKLIASEKAGKRSFKIWGKLFRAIGKPTSKLRNYLAYLYIVFLVALIIAVVPANIVIKTVLRPFTRGKIEEQKKYYEQPSGR